jgi:hypothetical protein
MNFDNDLGRIDTILSLDTTVAPPLGGTTGTLTVVGTGALIVPVGTTAQQPTGSNGMIRYNTDLVRLESWNGTAWVSTQLNAELTGLSGLSVNGMLARTGAGTYTSRTIAGTASNITVANGDGVAGAPTIDLATVTQGATGTSLVKVQLDTKGRVINNTAVLAADITTLVDATYVNVSGDSMSSAANLTFSGGGEVLGLPTTPTTSGSAASKAYVDALFQGVPSKFEAVAATTAALPAFTYSNGSSGSGATITETGNGALSIDGQSPTAGQYVLIKNETAGNAPYNGLYIVTNAGSAGTQFILTRAVNMDTTGEFGGAFIFVQNGSTNAATGWACTNGPTITVGTTNVTFTQISGTGTYTNGTGLSLTGTTFSLTAPVTLSLGGTNNASLSASNGGIVWSDASKLNVLAGTATANQILMSGASTTPAWSTTTYPTTSATGDLVYATGTNVLGKLTIGSAGQHLTISGGVPAWTTATFPSTAAGTGTILRANGTNWLASTSTFADTYAVNTVLYASSSNTVTGLAAGTANQILGFNNAGNGLEYKTVTAGTGITVTLTAANTITIATNSAVLSLYKENPSTPTTPTVTGTNSVAIGTGSSASTTNAIAFGQGTNSRIWGGQASANGSFATAGDAQRGTYIMRAITTDATAGVELFLDGAGAAQRLVLPNNSLFTFSILIAARRTDATGGGAGYKIEGVMKKDTTAGSTALVGTIAKTILGETNTAWDATVTADTTNGSLKVAVTGEAAKTIRWVATITTSEVTN